MITVMWRRVAALIVIFGWISLSGFDVVEDLDDLPIPSAVSKSVSDGNPTVKRAFSVRLANNMVELAYRNQEVVAILNFVPHIVNFAPGFHVQRHSPLHKLFRVLLI